MEEEQDLGAMLEEAVQPEVSTEMVSTDAEPAPSATDGAEEASTPPVQEEQIEEPQFNQDVLTEQLNRQSEVMSEMAKQISDLTNNVPKPQEPQPTEEDMLREQMKKDLGLDKVEAQMAKQEELIQFQKEQMERQYQEQVIVTRENEFKSLEKEYGSIDKLAIQNKLVSISKNNPDLAEALNSPDGVRMLLNQGVGVAQKDPDPITPSSNSGDVDYSNQLKDLKNGNLSDDAFGDLLFDSIS